MSSAEPRSVEPIPADLYAAAMALSPTQRERLANDRYPSLDARPDDEPDPDYDEAWGDEIERRLRSVEDGTAKLIPYEDVVARLNTRLRGRSGG